MATTYEAVHEVAVALLRGRVLRGVEADAGRGDGAWGIIDCSQALGAFDARSDAWCGRDRIPNRFTREEAERRARAMTGSSHEDTGYQALEIPSRPRVVMAGRHCSATDDRLQFECVDWTNGPGDVVTVGDAFDAARAFVALIGERLSYAAVYSGDDGS